VIHDTEVTEMLMDHLFDLTHGKKLPLSMLLTEARSIMAKRAFAHHLKYDILCLQEGDYLDASLFPENYEVLFSESGHSKNGVAWNKDRFTLLEVLGDIESKAFIVSLQDKENQKIVLVASGHFTGCNPYIAHIDANGILDSAKGDAELQSVLQVLEETNADVKLIGMDSNVTSLHPRLNLVKDAAYALDSENYLEPTCSNPHLVLNTRIDWIAVKGDASITNIPVLNVHLNHMQTNISDHKPIAAKVTY